MLVASSFLLWVAVILLTVAVVALARQIAALRERLTPIGGTLPGGAAGVGDLAPVVTAPGLAGNVVTVGGAASDGRASLLLFVSPHCQHCTKIVPIAVVLAKAEKLRLVFVGDGDAVAYRQMALSLRVGAYDIAMSSQITAVYQAGPHPYAVIVDAGGRIAGRGMVDGRDQLETLLMEGGISGQASLPLPIPHGIDAQSHGAVASFRH